MMSRLLVVDDEPAISSAHLKLGLEKESGHQVLTRRNRQRWLAGDSPEEARGSNSGRNASRW